MSTSTTVLTFTGELPPRFAEAFQELSPLLGLSCAPGGTPVEVFRTEGPVIERREGRLRLGWRKSVHLYRALSLLSCGETERREQPCFETGVMFDVSRNAVLRPQAVRAMLRKMALMGMDVGMLYTEDTYEVPGEPYIGYMRGRYSTEELRSLDDYADLLGIELIPCIQTLGHLNRVLHWPAMSRYADNSAVLLADEEDTYTLLERMIQAASAPYRSRRIHLGMDEADGIGLGAYLRRRGYESPHAIILRHLKRVKEITDRLGLQPMMWSDMYFRPDSPTGGYYNSGEPSAEAIASVVPGVQLVYWDYYHSAGQDYADMLDKHKKLSGVPIFAGGVWTWGGPAPDYEKTISTSVPALTACRRAGVPFALVTAWGDDGAETSLLGALPGMQLYAEFAYTGGYESGWLEERFRACCGGELVPFLGLSRFNHVPGMHSPALSPVNAAKFLLYQDPMVQLFAKDTEGLAMAEHYAGLAEEYGRCAAGGEYRLLMDFYAQLARVLAGKCRWHEQIAGLVAQEDRAGAAALAASLTGVSEAVEELRRIWRELWASVNKPYGFEIIDGRMGALRARLETAQTRVAAWAAGDSGEGLEELREQPLPFRRQGEVLAGSYLAGEIVSACRSDS